jgi:hypothetical protein
MRIVDYETFIRMPAGTIFAPFTPCVFLERFEVKVDKGWEGGDGDWCFNGTMPLEPWNTEDLFEGCDPTEAEFGVYDGDSVDASNYKLFCVLEPDDVKKLINVLHWALDGCPGEFDECTLEALRRIKKKKEKENDQT